MKTTLIGFVSSSVAPGFGDGPLKRVAVGLLLAFPPALLVSRSAADVIVVLIGLAFLVESGRTRHWEWLRDPVILAALALWGAFYLVVGPMAVDPAASFGRSLPWLRFPLFYAAMTAWLLADKHAMKLIAWWMTLVLAFVVVDCLTQGLLGASVTGRPIYGDVHGRFSRLTGMLSHPNIGSFLAKIGFPLMGLLLCINRTGSSRREIMVVSALGPLIFLTVLLTGERTVTALTLFGLALISSLVFVTTPGRRILVVSLSIALAGVVAAIIMLEDRVHQRLLHFIAQLLDFWESDYGEAIEVAWRIFVENPVTGVGIKNYREICAFYSEHCYLHPHNIYLELLSESGMVGFVPFTALVAIIFVTFTRRAMKNIINPAAVGFLAGALLLSLFPFSTTQSFFSNWPAMLLWYSIALAMAPAGRPWERAAERKQ